MSDIHPADTVPNMLECHPGWIVYTDVCVPDDRNVSPVSQETPTTTVPVTSTTLGEPTTTVTVAVGPPPTLPQTGEAGAAFTAAGGLLLVCLGQHVTSDDQAVVVAFTNFLSWGEKPSILGTRVITARRAVPPAWWAYAFGDTRWCPPKGEL